MDESGLQREYDNVSWHEEPAAAAGQPIEGAFAHIALYLEWLLRRGLTSPDTIPARFVAAVERNEVGPAEFMALTRGSLSPEDLSDEGRTFTDAYYGRYLDDFSALFGDEGTYGVAADADAFDQIARVIDQRHAEWIYAGRPEMPPEDLDDPAETLAALLDRVDLPPDLTREQLAGMSPQEVVELLTNLVARAQARPLQPSVDDRD